ncbi:hypothetical protein HDR63_01945 [bacterium]|nr:hypothetical protein [bacterium]
MMKWIGRLMSVVMLGLVMCGGGFAATSGDVDDFGTWATPHNRDTFVSALAGDIDAFGRGISAQMVAPDYVPVEAKVALAFMGGLSRVGDVLDRSLVRFVTIFLIIAYAFWIMFEAYQMMKEGQDVKKLAEDLVKKGLIITVWILIIEQGPAQIFLWILGPVVQIGVYLSDLILGAVGSVAGVTVPDTCAAIHNYVAQNFPAHVQMTATGAADLICLPTRLSGFFYAAAGAGWQWMRAGIGHSPVSFVVGFAAVVVFVYDIWKFALMALGVIADLFLGILMLPFTAIAEGMPQTSYKGIAGAIYNGFAGMFKTENLDTQIMRLVNAAIYYVSLSIVVAVCAALLGGVVRIDPMGSVSLTSDGLIIALITGLLIAHLANKADETARAIGGSVDGAMGKQFEDTIKKLGKNARDTAKSWWKAIRSK